MLAAVDDEGAVVVRHRPRRCAAQTESYFSRWASDPLSVRSFTATTSTPSAASDWRRKDTSDASEAVDADASGHGWISCSFLFEHLRCEVRVRAGDTYLLRTLVRGREESSDATGDRVLRHDGIRELSELLQEKPACG